LQDGKYKGSKPTARVKAAEVINFPVGLWVSIVWPPMLSMDQADATAIDVVHDPQEVPATRITRSSEGWVRARHALRKLVKFASAAGGSQANVSRNQDVHATRQAD
jgi:hypothetical protein